MRRQRNVEHTFYVSKEDLDHANWPHVLLMTAYDKSRRAVEEHIESTGVFLQPEGGAYVRVTYVQPIAEVSEVELPK